MRLRFAFVVLFLSSIACGQYVPTVTPVPSSTAVEVTQHLMPTLVSTLPAATVTQQPDTTTSVIVAAVVTVRNAPGGDPTGEYVTAGTPVDVLEVATDEVGGEWVRIGDRRWLWAGCVSNINEKGCRAE